MKTVKILGKTYEVREVNYEDLYCSAHHVSDWACRYARYVAKEVNTNKEWFLSYSWRKDLKEIANY